jgi:hypothetical protein
MHKQFPRELTHSHTQKEKISALRALTEIHFLCCNAAGHWWSEKRGGGFTSVFAPDLACRFEAAAADGWACI